VPAHSGQRETVASRGLWELSEEITAKGGEDWGTIGRPTLAKPWQTSPQLGKERCVKPKYRVVGMLLVLLAVLIAGGSVAVAQMAAIGETPFVQKWASSGHGDAGSRPFNYWNAQGQIPTTCAKCHSTPGHLDFLGMDGSASGVVDKAAPVGTTVQCIACHNDASRMMTEVTFPSGITVSGFEESARCAQCHQGRTSKVQVDAAIERVGLTGQEDTVSNTLTFLNIHYYAAAATQFGSLVKSGYEYEGSSYMGRFEHVPGYDTCADCHDPHSLDLKVDQCAGCHTGVRSVEDLRSIRMNGSRVDYDGDGHVTEGIKAEISTLQERLLQVIKAYGREVAGTSIGYNGDANPYYFIDTNDNGTIEASEAVSANRYNAFTPRLLKAAYNYQVSKKDPGAYAHNAKYIIQLLSDSIADLNGKVANPVNIDAGSRFDAGHFEFTSTAFRYWDAQGAVPATCSKCHSADGLPFLLQHGVNIAQEPSAGLACQTCHNSSQNFGLRYSGEVRFPSGATASLDDVRANLCIQCHQGRESTVSVNQAIQRANVGNDTVSAQLSFLNIHYYAAGATLLGSEVQGAYQYAGKQYAGRFPHVDSFNTCIECHDAHALTVRVDQCSTCHVGVQSGADLRNIRLGSPLDHDGDGNVTEGIALEIETVQKALSKAIQSYAANTAGTAIGYNPDAFPYWFVDDNGNGTIDAGETTRYNRWTPTLLRAAYNYQFAKKDPGAFAHNNNYVLQILYDSLEAIGGRGAVAGMVRP
jgi:hypothetical protein